MKKIPLLGGLTPAQFLRDYWHKKPLVIRQAIPQFKPFLARDELFALADNEAVESRLISNWKGRWDLQHGPLKSHPALAKKNWTLLVQGVNLHLDAADKLLRQFNFLPYARLDDLMISYAADGGGVGPHFDSYDVFLLQAHGTRRWRIGAQRDLSLIEGLPLKILQHFEPEQEYLLEPGDMLYLPPHYAHDGIAVGECMTYSIGFRAPSYQELGQAFLEFLTETIDLPNRYADADLQPSKHPAEISDAMLRRIAAELQKIRFDEEDIEIFLGEYLSEPKSSVVFARPARPLPLERFLQSAVKRGLILSPKAQMLHRNKHVFLNGESYAASRTDRVPLLALANTRQLDGEMIATASDDVQESLHAWYCNGWLLLR